MKRRLILVLSFMLPPLLAARQTCVGDSITAGVGTTITAPDAASLLGHMDKFHRR